MSVEIKKSVSAGTMESSDAYVEIEPASSGVEVQLESVVQEQFGEQIRSVVWEVLKEHGVEPVDRPELNVDQIGRGKELKFSIEVYYELFPNKILKK